MEIPDKQYFKIGEVARLLDEPPHVIRYWESEFSAIKPKRAGTSQRRLYRREDVALLHNIKLMLRDNGYTLAGAKKILGQRDEVAGETDERAGDMITVPLKLLLGIKEGLTSLRDVLAKKSGLSD